MAFGINRYFYSV